MVAVELGIDPDEVARLLAIFPGVSRRFEVVGGPASGIRVVDDYAHNGEKLRATLTTAQAGPAAWWRSSSRTASVPPASCAPS